MISSIHYTIINTLKWKLLYIVEEIILFIKLSKLTLKFSIKLHSTVIVVTIHCEVYVVKCNLLFIEIKNKQVTMDMYPISCKY